MKALTHNYLLMFRYKFNALSLVMILGIVLFLHSSSHTQERFGTLPMVQTSDSTPTSVSNNVGGRSNDFRLVKKIYDRLVEARGDSRFPVPQVFLRDEVSRVASIDYDNLEIVLELKAFNACKPYGDAAIAFLLGHELTHYYEKHAWKSSFASENIDLKVGKSIRTVQDQVANETQADYLGGFLAYSAGYGMFAKGDELIRGLYKEYGIGEKLEGYPSLTDRMELARRSAQKLESLVDVFEMANFMASIGKYPEAFEYYQYILKHYQSREIYNNVGVNVLFQAIQLFDPKVLKFKYVVELDLESAGSRDVGAASKREELLKQAIRYFDNAISLDPEYAPAYLNKATAYALLGDTTRAMFFANKEAFDVATRNENSKTLIDISILSGILMAKAGNTSGAQMMFERGVQMNSELAKENLEILKNGYVPSIEKAPSKTAPKDAIGGFDLATILSKMSPPVILDKTVSLSNAFSFFQWDSLDCQLIYNLNHQEEVYNYFLITKPNSKSRTILDIGIGSTMAEVLKLYGEASNRIETPQGAILVYPNLIFIIGNENKVTKWGSYFSKKSLF